VKARAWTIAAIAAGLCLAGLVAACGQGGGAGKAGARSAEITGAGATFPQPLYVRWAEQYSGQGGDPINYQGLGSGAGQNQIINRTVDFGASDAPVEAERLETNNLLQFPAVIGAVVVSVNVPDIDGNALKLDGPTIAQMYLGGVTKWNDARIAALNPGVRLPAVAIAPVYRADSSGTNAIFTSYLAAVEPQFDTEVGAGTSVSWKAGIGAPGNAGVAGAIRNTRGAIGYVEYAYAVENGMATPMLKNHDGAFVAPSMDGFAAAAGAADWAHATNMAATMINTPGAANWPIVSATYILLPRNPSDAERARKVLAFFDWTFDHGQAAADELHYVMLPAPVREQVRAGWCVVAADGAPVWPKCQ
jgi:phosphate transport system substrate-binding protein